MKKMVDFWAVVPAGAVLAAVVLVSTLCGCGGAVNNSFGGPDDASEDGSGALDARRTTTDAGPAESGSDASRLDATTDGADGARADGAVADASMDAGRIDGASRDAVADAREAGRDGAGPDTSADVVEGGVADGAGRDATADAVEEAIDDTGAPDASDASDAFVAIAPDAPTGVVATPGDRFVGLTWTAPADHGSPITGYAVTANPGNLTVATTGATSTSVNVPNLTNGTTYTFTVTATNAAGTSAPSAAVMATPAAVPPAPTGLSATAGDTSVALTWTAPADNGSPIVGYTVVVTPTAGTVAMSSPTSTSATVTGLTNGTAYTFTVTAINGVGPGAGVTSSSVIPFGLPPAPTGVTACAGDATVQVDWLAPATDNGSAISSYIVTPSPLDVPAVTVAATMTSVVVTGLTDLASYTFTVQAVNGAGTGVASTASSSVMPITPTWTNLWNSIVNVRCTGCHGASGGLDMSGSSAMAHANLLMPASSASVCSGQTRVVPGPPATGSLLYNKVNGTQTCGSRMPLGGNPYLCAPQISLFQAWIEAGAMNN